MNPEQPQDPREELELQITALLLGELDAARAERVRQAIAADPELAKLHEQLKETIDLVGDATTRLDPPTTAEVPRRLRLSEGKRSALLAHFKCPAPKPVPARQRTAPVMRWLQVAAVILILTLLAALLLPSLAKSKGKAQRLTSLSLGVGERSEEAVSELGDLQALVTATLPDESPAETHHGELQPARQSGGDPVRGLATGEVLEQPPAGGVVRVALPRRPDDSRSWFESGKTDFAGDGSGTSSDDLAAGGSYFNWNRTSAGVRDAERNARWAMNGEPALQEDTPFLPAPRPEPTPSVANAARSSALESSPIPLNKPTESPEVATRRSAGGAGRTFGGYAAEGAAMAQPADRLRALTTTEKSLSMAPTQKAASTGGAEDSSAGVALREVGQYRRNTDRLGTESLEGRSQRGVNPTEEEKVLSRVGEDSDHYFAGQKVVREQPVALPNLSWGLAADGAEETRPAAERVQAEALAKLGFRDGVFDQSSEPGTEAEALIRSGLFERQPQQDKKEQPSSAEAFPTSGNLGRSMTPPATPPAAAEPELDAAKSPVPAPAPVPQPEVRTADNPFSTFSLNVSDVSFKLAAASLEQGRLPAAASVRSEEFLNAFAYHDPVPAPGRSLGFAWERARYPFAHDRDVLRFSVQTAARGRVEGRPLNLVLLLDNSGSMERADRVRIIRECLNVLAGQLTAQDRVSVITFARTPRLRLDGVPGVQAAASLASVGRLTPEGGTNLEEAMELAYATARRHYLVNGVNRVVLLTDGAANLGDADPASLKGKVERHRRQGIALDCFGIGWEGYNDDLLEVLSRNGDGRYGFVNAVREAAPDFANALAGALHVAAADVKAQVEFNPQRVTAYRQIGYARHQLTREQFRDNTVDAAEIGAAESGNALYVVRTDPLGQGPIATVRARFRVPATGRYEETEWTVPYAGPALDLETSGAALRLAVVASAFSEWLAGSPFAGQVTPETLLNLLTGVPESFGADSRPMKLEWMIREAGRLAGN